MDFTIVFPLSVSYFFDLFVKWRAITANHYDDRLKEKTCFCDFWDIAIRFSLDSFFASSDTSVGTLIR